jgi:hypothetical protein
MSLIKINYIRLPSVNMCETGGNIDVLTLYYFNLSYKEPPNIANFKHKLHNYTGFN